MKINSVAATGATFHAVESTESAARDEHTLAATPDHARGRSNPFAVLGEALFRVRMDLISERAPVTEQKSGSGDANPQQAAQRHGIIVIGGSQARATASTVRDAIKQGPVQQGIIIVGGSDVGHALPKVR